MTRTSTTGYSTVGAKVPKIVYASEGRWRELYGHRCVTLQEAEAYVAKRGFMRVVYDGEELPAAPPDPEPEPRLPPLKPETIAMLRAIAEKRMRTIESEDDKRV